MVCSCSVLISDFWILENNDWLEEEWEFLSEKRKIFQIRMKLSLDLVPCLCKMDKDCIDCKCPVCLEGCHPECKNFKNNFPSIDQHSPRQLMSIPLSQWEKEK